MAVIQHHPTPNPNSLKFTWDQGPFVDAGYLNCTSAEEEGLPPLAHALITIEGVTNVFIMPAFATVTKSPAVSWEVLLPHLESAFHRA